MYYTIIKASNRGIKNVERIKNQLSDYTYVDEIRFIDAKKLGKEKTYELLKQKGIKISWNPYDGRKTGPMLGELGVWLSYINVLEYFSYKNIDEFIVFEDDAYLSSSFKTDVEALKSQVPHKNWDFLSLFYDHGAHRDLDHNIETSKSLMGSKDVHKAINQYAGAVGTLFSRRGAAKVLVKTLKEGIEYTFDCELFEHTRSKKYLGYSIRPSSELNPISQESLTLYTSTIDPKNTRHGG
jgi:GR25 family glycosyltransferase involved in LPS biosynthesis